MILDLKLFTWLHSLAGVSKFLDFVIVFFADYLAYILVAVFIFIIWDEKTRVAKVSSAMFVLLSALIARGIVTPIIRFFYNRPRPFVVMPDIVTLVARNAAEPSMPSGHAALFFGLSAAAYYLRSKWAPYILAGSVLMGIARVISGVHYPSDILVGALVGSWSVLLVKKFLSEK